MARRSEGNDCVSNDPRAHLSEFGFVVPKGVLNVERLVALAEAEGLPASALNFD